MATLIPLWTHAPIHDQAAIAAFLAARGVIFETWVLPPLARDIAAKSRPDDADKTTVIALFREAIGPTGHGHGYKSADVVAVRPDIPGIEDALAKFDKVHYHDDDEVRAIVGGSGVFGFVGDDGRQFLLNVTAGEYISVPAGAWHWFYCDESKNITAIRLFKDLPAWAAHYRSNERGQVASSSSS